MKKMTCEVFEREYLNLSDSSIDAARREELEEHTRHCSHCAQYSKDNSSVREALSSLPPIQVPPYFEANLKREINRLERGLKRPQWNTNPVPRFLAIGLGFSMAFVISLFISQPGQQPGMPGINQPGYMAESETTAPANTLATEKSITNQDQLLLVDSSKPADTAIHRLPEPAGMDSIPVPIEDDPWQINQVSTTPEDN